MRLLPIALGLPGTIGFPTAIAHHRSPHGQVTEVSYTGKNFIVYHPSHSNSAPTSRMDCFVDSLLGRERPTLNAGRLGAPSWPGAAHGRPATAQTRPAGRSRLPATPSHDVCRCSRCP